MHSRIWTTSLFDLPCSFYTHPITKLDPVCVLVTIRILLSAINPFSILRSPLRKMHEPIKLCNTWVLSICVVHPMFHHAPLDHTYWFGRKNPKGEPVVLVGLARLCGYCIPSHSSSRYSRYSENVYLWSRSLPSVCTHKFWAFAEF